MFVKKIPALPFLCLTVLVGGLEAQTRNVFVLPSAGTIVQAYSNDSFSSAGSFSSAPAPFLVLANGPGTKYYVISKSPANTVAVVDGANFSTLPTTFSFGANADAAAITPDGRRLLVLAQRLHIIDTASDLDLTPGGLTVSSNPTDIAVSLDSSRAYVLSKTSSIVTAVDLTSNLVTSQSLTVQGNNSTVSVAPNGLVYVTAINRIFEVDPKTLQVRNEIALNAVPGKPVYTPDGKYALFTNQSPLTGSSVILLDLTTRLVAGTLPAFLPNGTALSIDKVLIASNSLAYATSPAQGKLYSLPIPALSTGKEVSFDIGLISGVVTAAVSNEVQPRTLYVATNNALYRSDISPGSNLVAQQFGLPGPPSDLDFAGPAATGNPSQVLLYNNAQSVPAGTAYTPLVVRVTDSLGRPLANVPVTFSSSDAGASIQTPSTATSNDGFAQTGVTASNSGSQFTISVVAGSASQATGSFTLTATGTGTTGGGTTGTGGTGTPANSPISIISGNGQLIRDILFSQDLLGVVVRDASGAPVPGATVTFSITQGTGQLYPASASGASLGVCTPAGQTATCITDANGQTGVGFGGGGTNQQSFLSATVNAAYNGTSVDFFETTFLGSNVFGILPDPTIADLVPAPGADRSFTLQAGQILPGAIQMRIVATSGPSLGQGIPNVGLQVSTNQDPTLGPAASCNAPGGIALSDATGVVTCDLKANGKVGTAPLRIVVGSVNTRLPGSIRVTPGPPGLLNILQGNNQSGITGQSLPLALKVQVTDAFGNVLPAIPVTFTVVTPGSVTLSQVSAASDQNGQASALATLGGIPGPQQITVKAGNAVSTFTVTVNVTFGGITQVSGSNQTAVINQPFALPLVARVIDNKGAPLANTTVAFAVNGGSATLSAASATTNSSGDASVNLTAGSTAGPITVNATVGNFTTSFNLTSRLPGPSLAISGFRNGASFFPGVSPGAIVSIFGTGIAPAVQGVVSPGIVAGQLPTSLAGVDVTFNGLQAPIFSVSNIAGTEQVTVQVPFDLPPGQANVTVRVNGGSTTINNVPILSVQPGIFETADANGRKYAIATRPDGSFVSPANPARKGESVRVYLTGLGQVSPATATNRAGIAGQSVLAPLVVGVNNAGIPLDTAEYMPGVIGVYVITFTLPVDAPSGSSIPLSFAATGPDGNKVYSNTSNLAIQ